MSIDRCAARSALVVAMSAVAMSAVAMSAVALIPGAHAASLPSDPTRAVVVAAPLAGSIGYVTRTVVVVAGHGADFYNADTVFHDVVADDEDASGRVLFQSARTGDGIGPVVHRVINGVESLAPGSYPFHCSAHLTMTGSLVVQAAGAVG